MLTACRSKASRRGLLQKIENQLISIKYETDMEIPPPEKKAEKAQAEPPKPEEKKEEPKKDAKKDKKSEVAKTPETKQDDVLTEEAQAKIKEADEGSGIIEDTKAEDLLPPVETIGADTDKNGKPIVPPEPETVSLEAELDGDGPKGDEPEEPAPAKKPAAKKKTAGKKAAAPKAAAKKTAGKKKTVKMK